MPKKNGTHLRNTAGLQEYHQKNREKLMVRVEGVIQKLKRERQPINFSVVARTARVSNAWLYREPAIRQQIEQLRVTAVTPRKVAVPAGERISDASLRAQNEALRKRILELTNKIRVLEEQKSVAYGIISSNDLPSPD